MNIIVNTIIIYRHIVSNTLLAQSHHSPIKQKASKGCSSKTVRISRHAPTALLVPSLTTILLL